MTKRSVALILLLGLCVSALSAQTQYSGFLHLKDGTVVEFEDIEFQYHRDLLRPLRIRRSVQAPEITLEPATMQEVVWLEGLSGNNWESGTTRVHITLKNGQQGEFVLAAWIYGVRLHVYDSFAQSSQVTNVLPVNIARIVYGAHFGNARLNQRTGKVWPLSYRFDPYTGEQLVLVQSEGSFRPPGESAIAVVSAYRTRAGDVAVPGFYRVEIAPSASRTDGLTAAALDYSLTFVNPLASSADISAALLRLREAVGSD